MVPLQNPVTVVTLEMRRVPVVLDLEGGVSLEGIELQKLAFEIFPLKCVQDVCIPVVEGAALYVIPHCYFEGRFICSRSGPVHFELFVRGKARESTADDAGGAKDRHDKVRSVKAGAREMLIRENPWLTEVDLDKALNAKRSAPDHYCERRPKGRPSSPSPARSDASSGHESDPEHEDEAVPETEAEYNPDDLQSLRIAEAVESHSRMDFFVRILGGKWTFEHCGGIAANACSYFARRGPPYDWCVEFGFPKQKGYHYRNFGCREGPHILCNELVCRAQYFYDLWKDSPAPLLMYSDEVLVSYVDGDEFRDWMCGLAADSMHFAEGQRLRMIRPINPGSTNEIVLKK